MNARTVAVGFLRAGRAQWLFAVAWGISLVLAVGAHAGAVHDESVDGDFSDDRLAPTPMNFTLGVNTIIATSVSGDREYVSVTVPVGMQLSQIILVSYTGDDGTAFIGVQEGATLTEPPTGTDVSQLLGWTHFGTDLANVGLDILPEIAVGPGAIGFTPPLPASTYTFWMQQTGQNAATYQFDFIVTPTPGAAALFGLGALAMPRRRRNH